MHHRTPLLLILLLATLSAACAEESRVDSFPAADVPDDLARFDAASEAGDADVAAPPPDVRTQCFGSNSFSPLGQV